MITPTDPIIAPSRGSTSQVLAAARQAGGSRYSDVETYVNELWRLCQLTGIDFAVATSQWHLETGCGTTRAWITKLNPGGIGVTDTGDVSIDYETGANAARGHLLHLWAYATDKPVPEPLTPYLSLDPRFSLVARGSAPLVRDLQGKWATDPAYTDKLVGRSQQMFSELVYGRVPRPPWVERLIPDANNRAWDDLGPRRMKGIVYHRQVGTNWGTDGWFRMLWQSNGQVGGGQLGLTDFGIDHQTGEILRWNDHEGRAYPGISPNRAGWASGPWQNASSAGAAFVNKFGVNAINRDLVSLEIAGQYADAIGGKGFEAIVALSAWLADQARIPWTQYPLNPATGLSFVYTHNNFQNNKPCAGQIVINMVPNLIAATKERLRMHQQLGEAPPADPVWAWLFGSARDASGTNYVYSETGVVSTYWRTYFAPLKRWPRLSEVRVFSQGTPEEYKVFLFSDGTAFAHSAGAGVRLLNP